MLKARYTVRALGDATVGVNRAAEGDANPLNDRVIDVPAAHDRFDQTADGIDRNGGVRAVTDSVGTIDNPTFRVREHDAMTTATDFDGDG